MQTNNTFAIIFFTRKSRSNIKKLTIYARITVNGKRSEISLKGAYWCAIGMLLKEELEALLKTLDF